MFNFWNRQSGKAKALFSSSLHNERSFYNAFLKDLESCQKEVVIESPYLTASRMEMFYPIFEKLIHRGVKVSIVTRDPLDHEDEYMRHQATNEILQCIELGIKVTMLKGFHHRKIATIDRKILYEGSLNILSQIKSQELMRRIENVSLAMEMLNFLKLK